MEKPPEKKPPQMVNIEHKHNRVQMSLWTFETLENEDLLKRYSILKSL